MWSQSSGESMVSSTSSSVFGAAKGLLQEVETEARVGLETWAWLKTRVGFEIRVGLACARASRSRLRSSAGAVPTSEAS